MGVSKVEIRHGKLLEIIKKKGKVTVQEIIEQFNCSEATARRDLDSLEKSGLIVRTIGGAVLEDSGSGREFSFSEKKLVYWEEKERIASVASEIVEEDDVIALTGGTTTYLIARALKNKRNITVVTNAVNIATELSDAENTQVVMTGGVMRTKSYELCGPLAEKTVEGLNISKMFLGADAVSAELGFTMFSELENRIAQLLIARSRQVYVVFDHSKLGRASLFTILPFEQVTGVITNRMPDQDFVEACNKAGVKIYIPSDTAVQA